uniref:Glycosyltransferase n=2 Tax=Oryza punctata TaxID=4537 RepID=A0A0E0L583_ORYPU
MSSAIERAVSFHWLRATSTSRCSIAQASVDGEHYLVRYFSLIRRTNAQFRDLLRSTGATVPVGIVVIDTFCLHALDVPRELSVPAYGFFPCGAAALAIHLQLPSIQEKNRASFAELGDTPLELTGVPPLPASHVSQLMLLYPAESKVCEGFTNICKSIAEYDAVMVNTFESLESRAAGALRKDSTGLLPAGHVLPPMYCVGPLVKRGDGGTTAASRGSTGNPTAASCSSASEARRQEQLREIAAGLENSGHRFLWVVQAPRRIDHPNTFLDPPIDPDLDALLPKGFLERTSGRGVVVKLWAPQGDVLRHRATGAFVTHCGWNSVLEGIAAGVPMLCWPLYAEQMMNKVVMVEEMGVAVEMVGWQRGGLVAAEEVEAKVRLVMESEAGGKVRARVTEHMAAAALAWAHDGASRAAFARFLSYAEIRRRR